MLAPFCEFETAFKVVTELGAQSLTLWPEVIQQLKAPVHFQQQGSLVVAHASDRSELDRMQRRVEQYPKHAEEMQHLDRSGIEAIEPGLARGFERGLYFPAEGHVHNRELIFALEATLKPKVKWHNNTKVVAVESKEIHTESEIHSFDLAVDCRGMGAQPDLSELRGVRGEVIYLEAPEVNLSRPVRLMHPRYPIYIVPRPGNQYVIGASQIESEDRGPITLRSTMELLSAAYALHTGFAEARVIGTYTNCRPAFPDNLPRILVDDGRIRINGLYRHGFLLAPVVARAVADRMEEKERQAPANDLIYEDKS